MEAGLGMMMLQSIAALALVLSLFAGMIWGLKRLQLQKMPKDTASMRVIQRISLDSKHSLVEVSRGSTRYILALSPNDMRLIEKVEQESVAFSSEGSEQDA